MKIPLEISCRGLKTNPELEALIHQKADKLEQVCHQLVRCRVAIEIPQQHQNTGSPFRVRIQMLLPDSELVVRRESGKGDMHDQLPKVVRSAFDAARRQLKKYNDQRQGKAKEHLDPQTAAFVVRLFKEKGFGFIKCEICDREIYFHENSILHNDFNRLEIGTGVRFEADQGDEGPQASTVEIVDKPGKRITGGVIDDMVPLSWQKTPVEKSY